jgi:peptide/nickel transport system substrate-binding protein
MKMGMFIRLLSIPILVISWASWATPKLTLTAVAAAATATSTPAVTAPPAVEKLTIAVESWGSDEINPVQMKTVNFLINNHLPMLVTRDEHYNVVPALATKWEGSPEGWTFTLDPTAKWEDGAPITAEDVKFSFEAAIGMHGFQGSVVGGRIKRSVEAVEVRDAHTVFIRTKAPDAGFFSFYGGAGYVIFWIVPKHYLTRVGHDGYVKKPLGGGPYKVKEWVPGHRIVYERNEAFWGTYPWYQKPQARAMEVIRVPDGAARFAMLKSGQADVIVPIDLAIAKDLPRQRGKGVWVKPLFGTAQALISFNSVLAKQEGKCPSEPYWSCWPKDNPDVEVGPFADIRVREALELAIDKKTISDKIHGGLTTPTGSVYSLDSFGWRPEVANTVVYDPERAKHLLKEAGYPHGFATKLYFAKARPGIPEYLEAVVSMWDKIGVKAQLIEVESGTYWDRIRAPARAYQPLVLWTWGRQDDASIIADYSFHRAGTYVGAFNERTNELYAQLMREWDDAKRAKLIAEIEDEVLAHRWYIPLYNFSIVYGYTDRVLEHLHRPVTSHIFDFWRIALKN